MAYRALIFVLLLVSWVLFSGLLDPFHLSLGVICSAVVTYLSGDLVFADRGATFEERIRQGYRMVFYVFWLLWQIVLANLQVLRLALFPGGPHGVQPTIVAYKTPLKSDFEKFILANSITLTPGTVTARIDGDTLFIHAINEDAVAGLNGEMDRRIARIFHPGPVIE